MKSERILLIVSGFAIGIIAALMVFFGNPVNMGFCIACFIRDSVGGLGLHRAEAVQYVRPEIIGLVLGAFIMAFSTKEFSAKGGSAPLTRFILGFFVMIGCLIFLGCPFRVILRLAGGDLNAIFGLLGFAAGIGLGVLFLNKGYSLSKNYKQKFIEGTSFPTIVFFILLLLAFAPSLLMFTEAGKGPGASHAPLIISLIAGLLVGAIAQKSRMCMVGGIRDILLFRDFKLISGFVSIFVAALIVNLIIGKFNPGFASQPIAHTDGLWNFLGMTLAGLAATLLGGCPLRQLVLAGEGNSDSAITVLGLAVGAAFAHNFGLAASGKGVPMNGKIAVIIGFIVVAIIGYINTRKSE